MDGPAKTPETQLIEWDNDKLLHQLEKAWSYLDETECSGWVQAAIHSAAIKIKHQVVEIEDMKQHAEEWEEIAKGK